MGTSAHAHGADRRNAARPAPVARRTSRRAQPAPDRKGAQRCGPRLSAPDLRRGTQRAARRIDGAGARPAAGRRGSDRRRNELQRDEGARRSHGPGQHDGARGIPGMRAARRLPAARARRPGAVDPEYAAHHQRTRSGLAPEIRGSLQLHQRALRHRLPVALRRRHGRDAARASRTAPAKPASTSWRSRRASACRTFCCSPAAKRRSRRWRC